MKGIFTDRSSEIVNTYLREIRGLKPISKEDEYELWENKQQGDEGAREKIIEANTHYVVTVAKNYLYTKVPFADLIQAGNEGLVKAVDRFDTSHGTRLLTYAVWYIDNEIRKMVNEYKGHRYLSLDEPLDCEEEKGTALIDMLKADSSMSADWNLRCSDALERVKIDAEKRMFNAGVLVEKLNEMLQRGYSVKDFARRYNLNDLQLDCFLGIIRNETDSHIGSAV
jgi:RNA polymerase sigma factor (sigma-70 family)